MKRIILPLIIVISVSCNSKVNLGKYQAELPDSTMINEVFNIVVQIDSFRTDYGLSNKLIIPILYNQYVSDNDSIPPPPPPPTSYSYEYLFKNFESDSLREKRFNDSIFFKLQLDSSKKNIISKNLINHFSNDSSRFYLFYWPIFSYDKQFVIITYWRNCGGLCGTCHEVILRKVNNCWIKIKDISCGES